MTSFVDRRLNPKDRSLGNRRRFLARVRGAVKEAVDRAVRERGIADVARGEKVSVPTGGIAEPSFHHAATGGRREEVLPGNRSYRRGDTIERPKAGGGRGRAGAAGGEGEDEFVFLLTREEFLDILFEDLDLPDLVKRHLSRTEEARPVRAGFAVTGAPANLNVTRTMRQSWGRRVALRRPKGAAVAALEARIAALEASGPEGAERVELERLRAELAGLERRRRIVPFLDPLDLRYTRFEPRPEPVARAVMFCLMDVSASMGVREKDLAKRFFVLLHLFLLRRYEEVELVFIRHTHVAREVDEETFFHARDTGGTVVSTALREMAKVIAERYPPADWNIYAAQASDGENLAGDSAVCADLLEGGLLRLCQFFAYVEIAPEGELRLGRPPGEGMELWRAYRGVGARWPSLAMKRITRAQDIYPVFRELFRRDVAEAGHG